jgi:hypothetical protein
MKRMSSFHPAPPSSAKPYVLVTTAPPVIHQPLSPILDDDEKRESEMLRLHDELETNLWKIVEAKREKAQLRVEQEKVERDAEIIWEAEQLHVALDHEDKEKCVHQHELLRQEAGQAPPASTSRAAVMDIVCSDDKVIILENADQKYANRCGTHD